MTAAPGKRRFSTAANNVLVQVVVTAVPARGAANEACARALAAAFDVKRRAVHLAAGSRGRRKKVQVCGDPDALGRRLAALAASGSTD